MKIERIDAATFQCPECAGKLEYMAIWDERLMYICDECLCTWQVYENENGCTVIERYFFG